MSKFVKKPVVIEAMLFNRHYWKELQQFTNYAVENLAIEKCPNGKAYCEINTLEGCMEVTEGDWVIMGVKGEYYACKPDIFEMTYDKILEGAE